MCDYEKSRETLIISRLTIAWIMPIITVSHQTSHKLTASFVLTLAKTQGCRHLIQCPTSHDLLNIRMFLSLKQYSYVADNTGDAVLLHVSASSERQERRNETSIMTKRTARHILTHSDVCGPTSGCPIYLVHYAHIHVNSINWQSHSKYWRNIISKPKISLSLMPPCSVIL
jgi:hypothetical protein